MSLIRVRRADDGSVKAHPDDFPAKEPKNAWAVNQFIGWQDPGTPVMFPGCFPWLPGNFDMLTERAPMIPDRAAIVKANRDLHVRAGMKRSFAEFLPGQPLGKIKGKKVIFCGSGTSLGTQRQAIQKARVDGAVVVCVNGAIEAIPNADVYFCLERAAKPEWWKNVDPNKTPIWTSPSANYSILDKWPVERRFYFLHHWDVFDGWSGGPEIIKRLPQTVSCMVSSINALQLVAWCEPSEIWIVGQDFAGEITWDGKGWAPGGYYWDGGFPEELHGEAATLVRSINGWPCGTTARLVIMGKAMELSCKMVELNADIPVKNIGRFGLLDLPDSEEFAKYRD